MNYRIIPFLFWAILLAAKGLCQTPNSSCDSIINKGYKLFQERDYKGAIAAFEQGMRICSKDTGMSDADYYSSLGVLSFLYYEHGNEDSALITGEPARKFLKKTAYFNGPIYASFTVRLALAYVHKAKFENAINCFEEVIPFLEKSKGLGSKEHMLYSMELATCYTALSNFSKSIALHKRLKNIAVSMYGKEHEYYIGIVTNMGNDFAHLSQFDSALAYHSESLSLREKKFGKSHPEYGKGLSNLGAVYNSIGRYADAIILYEQAKAVYANAKKERSAEYAGILGEMGLMYTRLQDYAKADRYLNEALGIKVALYGYYHPEVASIYNSIASLYSDLLDYDAAIKMFHKSKTILEKTTGTSTYEYANVVGNLGLGYAEVNKFDSALYFLEQALTYKEKLFGADNYALGSVLNNLASVHSDLKNYDKAISIYNRSLSIVENTFGTEASQLVSINENLSLVYKAKGDLKAADNLLQKAYSIQRKIILQNTEGLSEGEKESFASAIRFQNYIAFGLRKEISLPNDWLFNSSLFYKGLLLEGSRGLTSAFKQFTDTGLKKKSKEYLELKSYVGQQLLLPATNRDKNLVKDFARSEELERELLQASAGFRSWKEQFNIDWVQIQKRLGRDEAAIEFVSYYPFDRKDSGIYYAALVLKQGASGPQLLHLFKEAEINKLLIHSSSEAIVKKLYRSTITSSTKGSQPSDSLYNIIWKPLLPALQNVTKIYFAADGVLNNLNLAAIISPQGKRLVEDYEFIQLTSTRNLLKKSGEPSFKDVQLWGGIQYNDGAATASTRSAPFSYLPGTLTEITEITNAATKAGAKTKALVAANANEAAFKSLSGQSPEVLHIATHGFFFPPPSPKGSVDDNRFAQSKVSLLRSGLALASSNENWKVMNSKGEDGILTAYEIADMDLSNTKLVVLSACETGLGDVKSGEGVYGLQRAFKMAGVNYLIMSLWQVPDMETKEFMQTFYTHCMSGLPIRKAFRETQLAMNRKYQPYQWAAFVLVE